MTTSAIRAPVTRQHLETSPAASAASNWRGVYVTGAIAALVIVALMPVQLIVFVVWPPPDAVIEWFELFQDNWFLGLLSLDLLYLFSNVLLGLVYLALYLKLRDSNPSATIIGLTLGMLGIAAYFASNVGFEMWEISNGYAAAATAEEQAGFLAAGEATLANYVGTTFVAYYLLNAVALLVFAAVMLKSSIFSRVTAYMGLLAGLLMVVPSTFGTAGLIFSVASLVPWAAFSVLVARRLLLISEVT